jgi:energy-coupling factor transport system ATP-binding protein
VNILIKIKNLSHIYNYHKKDQIKALDSISLEIKNGDFISIIGSNGSGKSTLAKHMNCLLLPTNGDIWVDKMNTKDKSKTWEIRRKVGMVFQNPDNQIIATTVEDDIAFGLENLHSSYLVLDEPTAMLDPRGRKEVINIVKKLNREENITIIYITHLMEEAAESNRVIALNKGKIALVGNPEEVFTQIEVLKKLRLDVPQITELALRLNKRGIDISSHTLKIEDMVESLCLYI